jgi:hypothetical protein
MIDVDVADYWSLDTHDPRPHSSRRDQLEPLRRRVAR